MYRRSMVNLPWCVCTTSIDSGTPSSSSIIVYSYVVNYKTSSLLCLCMKSLCFCCRNTSHSNYILEHSIPIGLICFVYLNTYVFDSRISVYSINVGMGIWWVNLFCLIKFISYACCMFNHL